jgi:hypothetical protein
LVAIAHYTSISVACPIVGFVVTRQQLPGAVTKPTSIEPANDFALTISNVIVVHKISLIKNCAAGKGG